jgi:hypothetical protein
MLMFMFIRRALPILVLACGLAGTAAWCSPPQALPTPYPADRYQPMSGHSPFAVATASAPEAAATPGFAAQLYVDGVVQVGTKEFAAIKSRDTTDMPNTLFLAVGATSNDGLKVEAVNWADEVGKSTVEVSKGGERALLSFDEATVKSSGSVTSEGQVGIRLPTLPGQGRPLPFPVQPNGQPGFNRFFPGQPGQVGPSIPAIDMQRRRIRGLIPSG